MSDDTRVDLAELRLALSRLLAEVERRHGPVVDLGRDHYWTVGSSQAFQFTDEVTQPTVGQLTDDVRTLREMLTEPVDASTAVWHDLAHLAGILGGLAAVDLETPYT